MRFGDLGSWAIVSLAIAQGWSATVLSAFNAVVAGVWVVVALELARRYSKALPAAKPVPGLVPATVVPAGDGG